MESETEGKRVSIFYDSKDRVSRKDGVVKKETDSEYVIEGPDGTVIIPKDRVVRVEVQSQ